MSSAHGRAGPVVREPDRRLADRASAPSLPAWRAALYTALLAVGLLSLFALIVVMEPMRGHKVHRAYMKALLELRKEPPTMMRASEILALTERYADWRKMRVERKIA